MGRPPLKILLVTDGTEDAPSPYLELLLSMPGVFQVRRDGDGAAGAPDAMLFSSSRAPRLVELTCDPAIPIIVLAGWRPSAQDVEAMVEEGAEDVIPLSELSGSRLEAAVRKAIVRRARTPVWRLQSLPATAAFGLSPWPGAQWSGGDLSEMFAT